MYGKEAKLCTKNLGHASLYATSIKARAAYAGVDWAASLMVSRRLNLMYFGCGSVECVYGGTG